MYNKDLYPKANKVLLELRTNKANPPFLGHQNPAAKKNQSNKSLCLMLEAPLFMVKYLEIHLAGRKKKPTLPRRGRVFRGRALQPCASLSTTCPVDTDMEWYEWIGFRQNLQDTIFFPPNMDLVWIYFGVQYRAVGGIHRSGITTWFTGAAAPSLFLSCTTMIGAPEFWGAKLEMFASRISSAVRLASTLVSTSPGAHPVLNVRNGGMIHNDS